LVRAVRFSVAQRVFGPDADRDYFEGQMIRAAMDRDIFVKALHLYDPNVVTLTDFATDANGHRFWRYHEPEAFDDVKPEAIARWGDAVSETYRQADEILGELLDLVPEHATVVVVSDHGFRALEKSDLDHYLAPRTDRLQARLQDQAGELEIMRLGQKLVIAAKGDDAATQLEQVAQALSGWTVGSLDQPLYRTEPMPDNPRALGLSLTLKRVSDEMLANDTVGGEPLSDYLKRTEAYSGEHTLDGIFAIRGPGIRAGQSADTMQMLDLAPTLLAILDLPAGKDMTGVVFEAAWTTPPSLPEGPISYDFLVPNRRWTGGEEGVNEAQLRALGYME
jgi:arylsulfatase A-like enzyme